MTPEKLEAMIDTVVIAILIVVAAAAGWHVQGWRMGDEMATMRLEFGEALSAAESARITAEGRASLAESKEREYFANALAEYKESQAHEQATSQRTIADLRAGIDRLRVRTTPASRSCTLPAAAAGTTGGDDPGEETLAPAVAARLAGRYADYNALVDRLTLCQAVVRGRQSAAPPAP